MKKTSGNIMIFLGSLCMLGAFGLFSLNYSLNEAGAEHCASIASEFTALVSQPEYFPSTLEEEVETTPLQTTVRNEGILIQGDLYIGLLEIPSLALSLPIHMDLTYSKLETAPCVYTGNLMDNNLVIAGHNYRSHFWYLRNLGVGAALSITNPNGKVYRYQVTEIQTLHETQVAELEARDDWALTLFTCDYPDSSKRIVIRCQRIA